MNPYLKHFSICLLLRAWTSGVSRTGQLVQRPQGFVLSAISLLRSSGPPIMALFQNSSQGLFAGSCGDSAYQTVSSKAR